MEELGVSIGEIDKCIGGGGEGGERLGRLLLGEGALTHLVRQGDLGDQGGEALLEEGHAECTQVIVELCLAQLEEVGHEVLHRSPRGQLHKCCKGPPLE